MALLRVELDTEDRAPIDGRSELDAVVRGGGDMGGVLTLEIERVEEVEPAVLLQASEKFAAHYGGNVIPTHVWQGEVLRTV